MIKYKYESTGWRPTEEIRNLKVVDVGGANSFASSFLDAVVDIRPPLIASKNDFVGDINMPEVWEEVLKHVEKYGKWDYAICTHTLEDINNPLYVCRMIEKIANKGIIVEPSKYREFARFSGTFRGFIHHRWIFDIIDGKFTGFPKINYIEDPIFDNLHKPLNDGDKEELIVEWEGEIGMRIINDDMPFNGEDHIRESYQLLLK